MSTKRLPREDFEKYKARRKNIDWLSRLRLKAYSRVLDPKPHYTPADNSPKPKAVSKSKGKRHRGESATDFKARRKKANANKRKQERLL